MKDHIFQDRFFFNNLLLTFLFSAAAHWNTLAQDELKFAKKLKPNIAVAKNVIVFLGDGMGVSTVTAARILKGQLQNKTGEEEKLHFEAFPYVGLSKVDHSV